MTGNEIDAKIKAQAEAESRGDPYMLMQARMLGAYKAMFWMLHYEHLELLKEVQRIKKELSEEWHAWVSQE